jgi:NitT/TauT family transport system substrate-binding protein
MHWYCLAVALAITTTPFAAKAGAAEHVVLRLSYTPYAVHIPAYVAKAQGYYEKAGLDVDILPGRGSSVGAELVGSGKEPFGLLEPAAVLAARAQGIPIVVVATLAQDGGLALFAREQSGIEKVEDMKGRNIGVYTGSTTTIFLQALLKQHGLSMDDIKPVTVRSGTDLPLVLDGKIDAEVTVYTNELTAWRITHPELKLRIWHMADLGFAMPGASIVTNETMMQTNPQLVKAFTLATVQGLDYALKHPEDAVKDIVTAVPELQANVEAAKWDAMIPAATSPATQKDGLGTVDHAKWQQLDTLLATYGAIKAPVDLGALLKDETHS